MKGNAGKSNGRSKLLFLKKITNRACGEEDSRERGREEMAMDLRVILGIMI